MGCSMGYSPYLDIPPAPRSPLLKQPTHWACLFCTRLNRVKFDDCQGCGAARPLPPELVS